MQGRSIVHMTRQHIWAPGTGHHSHTQVPVDPQGRDNGAIVEKNMIIKLIQSLVSTLQLNERPKSQAGQQGKVNIDLGRLLGPAPACVHRAALQQPLKPQPCSDLCSLDLES